MARTRTPPDQRLRYRIRSVGWALVVLSVVAGLTWLVSDADGVLAVALGLLVAVVIDGYFARRSLRGLVIHLQPPAEIVAGLPSTWTLATSGWKRPVRLDPLLCAGSQGTVVASPGPARITWPPVHRSPVPFLIFDLTANGPLGLVGGGRRVVHVLRAPAFAFPAPVPDAGRWPQPRAVAFGFTEGAPIGDDLFRTIRPYRSGDERRRVDWKSTAHHGELMVRECEGSGIARLRLVVDLGAPGPGAELAAGRARWIGATAMERGWLVDLVTLDASRHQVQLLVLGQAFGAWPTVDNRPQQFDTLEQPVTGPHDLGARLASTAFGTPAPASAATRGATTCTVSQAGVSWS